MRNPGDELLTLTPETRDALWAEVFARMEGYLARVSELPVKPPASPEAIAEALAPFDFATPRDPRQMIAWVTDAMERFQLHTAHPVYYGVFNPAPSTMGIAGETLAAAYNAQLASWTSSPFAIELEQKLLRQFASHFGYTEVEGTFTTGGTEANHSALLVALTRNFPQYASGGARALPGQPTLYVSLEAHHSFLKAARLCGLGTEAVREIPVSSDLKIDPAALEARVRADRAQGFRPFFVVGTAGTTNAGVIDRLPDIAAIARREGLWFHCDAAWGGAAVILPEHRALFDGIEASDSATLDAHKWLSVPMTAGLFLCRHPGLLERAFRVGHTHYMPPSSQASRQSQPYAESMPWSRRFLGLKLFLSLAVAGWDGYREILRHQIRMGDLLRERLAARDWEILNRTALPVVCFVDKRNPGRDVEAFAAKVAATGRAWITTVRLRGEQPCLRAGIACFKTAPEHLDELVQTLEWARE